MKLKHTDAWSPVHIMSTTDNLQVIPWKWNPVNNNKSVRYTIVGLKNPNMTANGGNF